MINQTKCVLRYPGSKWRIASEIVALIPEHHSYVEPYFGSGAVLFTKHPSNIELVNDLDGNVTNVFKCIQQDSERSERLARLAMTTSFSRETYEEAFNKTKFDDDYEKALNFLICCWQGHGFRTNGYKVGWKNDVIGREKMYALWNWYRLPTWIVETAERLRQTQIENRKAIDVIKRFDHKEVFMYIDPPYLLETRAAKQYQYEMNHEDHIELLEAIIKSNAKIMISGYDNELYNEYLVDWQKEYFNANAEYGLKRTEVVWMNYDLQPRLF